MHAMFEPSAYFLDPTSEPETTTSFLSFASFADLDFTSSAWNIFSPNFSKSASDASDTSSPSPSEPCQVIASAFDAPSPVTDIGIFHTPAKAGPSKLSGSDSSVQTLSHRSSTSSEGWNTPLTPSLTTKSSSDSFHFATGNVFYLSSHRSAPFSWDDASTTLASSSYESPTPAAHRTTSNLTLGSSRLRPPVKPVVSMPALKEEVASTPSQWFDGTEYAEASTAQHVEEHFDGAGYVLTDDFDSVFGDYGLGDTVPAASTIFAAFHSDHPTPCDEGLPSAQMYEHHNPPADMSWLPGPSTQDVSGMGEYDFSTPSFTINPIAVMATSGVDEQPSRPSSAPRLNGDEGSEQMLSVPMGDMMTRR
jgi:hypothetical protein